MNWLDWILTSARFVSLAGSILLAAIFGFYLLTSGSTRLEFFPKRLTLILAVAACLGQVAWVCALFWSMDPDVGSGGFEDFSAFFFATQVGKIGLLRCCLLIFLVGHSAFRSYRSTRRMSAPPSLSLWVESVLVLMQLVLLSWLSHAAAGGWTFQRAAVRERYRTSHERSAMAWRASTAVVVFEAIRSGTIKTRSLAALFERCIHRSSLGGRDRDFERLFPCPFARAVVRNDLWTLYPFQSSLFLRAYRIRSCESVQADP